MANVLTSSALPGVLIGLASIGGATALAATGNISGADAVAIYGVVLGSGAGIVGAHVGANAGKPGTPS